MATACPKCHRSDTQKAPGHSAAHAAHGLHMLHQWPIVGVITLIATAIHALAVGEEHVCRRCGHKF